MKPERAQEIDRIFATALELKHEARVAYLGEACGRDSDLRREVESLLAREVSESPADPQEVEEATRPLTSRDPLPKFIGLIALTDRSARAAWGRYILPMMKDSIDLSQ